ncbi:CDP-6-deoxy-delta-3,4-glucoseen reductase [Comamonas kerstersii]|uniref:CDP-6-deoxy-delta-3,4-glucoseen reductase n=1 Tax=Comamonas kerstersii TaxID=225992 RepID=A0A6A1R5G3_9BURK|nr:CDP-6-deoxy-delta-3,4-glucoseen reductase [Comamonas kerstersii]KAB0588035.1 CDP-6-deoxy-delta-3,4-glucoseen reductase [Comamonas kerstersii]
MNASTFQITVEPSGRQFSASGQETILAAAIHAGVGLPYGCKDGACGSCKCKKLSGEVTHEAYSENALSEAELAAGLILTCRATATSDVVLESRQVTGANAFPIKKMPVRVNALEKLSHDVMRVQLQLPAHTAFQFHAGQYLEFILRDGSRRAYSMATPPHVAANTPAIELHIRHMPGGKFTDHVFGAMKEKEILRAEGPFGSFFLREDSDKPMVFLASGTGFAPIKALLEHMQHKVMTRPVSLYWGGRRPEDLYMDAWLKELSTSMPNLSYVPVISDALPEDHWSGRTGYVHQAVLDDFADLSGHEVYACGAPVVVDAARSSYTSQRGLPEECFFADAFTSEADK